MLQFPIKVNEKKGIYMAKPILLAFDRLCFVTGPSCSVAHVVETVMGDYSKLFTMAYHKHNMTLMNSV